jgi:hypothetical protein
MITSTTRPTDERTPSNTLALRSNQRDRNINMMKEFAILLSAFDRVATAAGHHSGMEL